MSHNMQTTGSIDAPAGLAEYLPQPVLVFANDLALRWVNAAAERLLKRGAGQLHGMMAPQLCPGFGALTPHLQALTGGDRVVRGDDLFIQPRGREIKCGYTVFPVPGGIAVQLTEFASEDWKSKSTGGEPVNMLGKMLAHELKNPLAGIKGAAQLLAHEVDSDDGRELCALIENEAGRIGRLAGSMENFAQIDDSEFRAVNIHEVMRNAALLFASAEHPNIIIRENYDPSLPDTYGDPDGLMQIVINLISNAREAMGKDGGEIILRSAYRTGVNRRTKTGDSVPLPVQITITDTGPGIPPDILPRMFQPFVTSKNTGQGLGLAFVAHMVEAHRGLIDVNSAPGHTSFSILFPDARRAARN